MIASICITMILIHTVCAKVYDPCELARELYSIAWSRSWDNVMSEIPMLVCAAGFQQYSSQFHQYKYHGIFGLTVHDRNLTSPFEEGTVTDDLDTFAHIVLQLGAVETHPNYQFYQKLCSKPNVNVRSCYLRHLVFSYEVYTPSNLNELNALREAQQRGEIERNEYEFRQQKFSRDATSLEQLNSGCPNKTSGHLTALSKAVFLYSTFWLTGSTIIIVAAVFLIYIRVLCMRVVANW